MAEIPITWIETDTPEAFPTAAVDAMGPYMPFAVDSEAGFAFAVSSRYIVGSNLVLKLKEATLGESLKHKWQIDILLNGSDTEAFTSEVTSAATADTLSTRLITISTDGAIDGTAIAPNDLIYLKLTRIDASASEDPNPIRVYLGAVQATTYDLELTDCIGDVGYVMNAVLVLVNDTRQDFAKQVECLAWINECTGDIAQEHHWKKITELTFDTTGTLELLDELEDYEKIFLIWEETTTSAGTLAYEYTICQSREEFTAFKTRSKPILTRTYDQERYALIEDNKIEIWPLPETTITLKVDHSYCPADVACLEMASLRVQRSHRDAYVKYCRWREMKKDSGRQDWTTQVQDAWQEYVEAKGKLLGSGIKSDISMGAS